MCAIVNKYGLSGVTNYWCEDVSLFQLKFSALDGMKRFIRSAEKVKRELANKIAAQLAEQQHSNLQVVVDTEVFLLTPDPVNKDAHLTTDSEISTCLTLWRESKVFDFRALFTAYRTRTDKYCGK